MAFTAFEHNTWLPWDKDHQWEIVTSALDGSDERRVTKTGNRGILNLNPVWSPDGTRIAFTSNRVNSEPDGEEAPVGKYGIFTMAPDGSDASRVAPSLSVKGSNPVWSPDGRSLAFVATEPGEGFRVFKDVLYVVGSDGSGLTRIGEAISWLTWSPDSSRIAFVGTDGVEVALHTVAPDGSDPTRVLGLRDVDMVPFGNLSWAPDGASILLSGGRKVVVVDADGSGLQLLTNLSVDAENLYASWSRDDSRIAVYSPVTTTNVRNGFDIVLFTMARDGSDKRVLVRYRLNPERMEATHGESWPPGLEWPATPTPTPSSLSTNGSKSAPSPVQPKGAGMVLDEGSVDVLVKVSRATSNASENWTLDIPGGDANVDDDDIIFNTCQPRPTDPDPDDGFENYALMVHEAGHALDLSDYTDQKAFDTAVAHPSIPDAVMNYDCDAADHNYADGSADWLRVRDEPNCSPHPMDIMAIHALYQTLNP